jgi:hypothetical protein
MMDLEVESLTGAAHGERSPARINHRNGYRRRAWDARVGTVDLEIPKLRKSSYFPALLERRRPAFGVRSCAPAKARSWSGPKRSAHLLHAEHLAGTIYEV